VRLERIELRAPEALDVVEPAAHCAERLGPQRVHARASVFVRAFFDEPRFAQDAQVLARRGSQQIQLVCDLAGAAWLPTEELDHRATRGIGQREHRAIELGRAAFGRSAHSA
jgi:hypothetical protein